MADLDTLLVYNMSAPTAFENIGWKYYLVFIAIMAVGLVPFIKLLPETKGLSLEEVQNFSLRLFLVVIA